MYKRQLRGGVEAGIHLIDTAEMYGSGRSEEMIGEAIAPCNREELFLVSKVYPQNAGKARLEKSLDQSLRLLGTDYLDLYLLPVSYTHLDVYKRQSQ